MKTFSNYVAAAKRRRAGETADDAGFSLIELIVVVVILGILVAIAIPVFMNIQDTAKQNAASSVAANAATQAASAIAQGETIDDDFFDNFIGGETTDVDWVGDVPAEVDDVCVTATVSDVEKTSGPGCP